MHGFECVTALPGGKNAVRFPYSFYSGSVINHVMDGLP
jgi:hypothetical protein